VTENNLYQQFRKEPFLFACLCDEKILVILALALFNLDNPDPFLKKEFEEGFRQRFGFDCTPLNVAKIMERHLEDGKQSVGGLAID